MPGLDQIPDHTADISLLRGIVVRACVVARDSHGPRLMPGMQVCEKAGRVVDIAFRIEHLTGRGK